MLQQPEGAPCCQQMAFGVDAFVRCSRLACGSGKAGRHVAPYLAEQGHQVTNADLVPLGHPDVADLRVDLTDAGETWS